METAKHFTHFFLKKIISSASAHLFLSAKRRSFGARNDTSALPQTHHSVEISIIRAPESYPLDRPELSYGQPRAILWATESYPLGDQELSFGATGAILWAARSYPLGDQELSHGLPGAVIWAAHKKDLAQKKCAPPDRDAHLLCLNNLAISLRSERLRDG